MVDITIRRGTRAFVTGTSGSGKTMLALRLAEAMPAPLVILDTKYDPSLKSWAQRNRIKIWARKDMPAWKSIKRDMIIRPHPTWLAHPEDIDWWLGQAFDCRYIPSIYIDEGYQAGATASRMGEGVTGLWTRGRAFGFRTIIGAQRPSWLSKFVISESDVIFVGRLNLKQDRAAIADATGFPEAMDKQDRHHFLYLRQSGDEPVPLKPIDITAPSLYSAASRHETMSRMQRQTGSGFWS